MKKKNLTKEEKKERNLKILKMCLYGGGLLLCAGAFVSLLVIGIRGCAATPKSSNADSSEVVSQPDSINNVRRDNLEIDYSNYDAYVLEQASSTSPYDNTYELINDLDYDVDYYINGYVDNKQFTFVNMVCLEYNNVVYDTLNFYGNSSLIKSICIYELFGHAHIFNGSILGVTESQQVKPGDFFYFEKGIVNNLNDDIDGEIEGNMLYRLVNGGCLRPYVNMNLSFLYQINRYGPLGQDNSVFATGNATGENTIFAGLFRDSVGNLYDRIIVTYADADGSQYTSNGSSVNVFNASTDTLMYINLIYRRLDTYTWGSETYTKVTVNHASYVTVDNKFPVYTNNSIWSSTYFQNIHIITIHENSDRYSGLPAGDYSRLDVLTSFNNIGNLNNGGSTGGASIGSTSPFSLIGSAFSALLPLFNVYLWPGVTIGVLLFIPLVASIVLFVVWLFKR